MSKSIPAARERRHQEIRDLIIERKSVPCERCGQPYPTVCMDFDHLPGAEKSFNIGTPSNWTSVARVKNEIAKCQVICSNCHRIVTWERKHGQPHDPPTWLPRPTSGAAAGGTPDMAVRGDGGEVGDDARDPRVRTGIDIWEWMKKWLDKLWGL